MNPHIMAIAHQDMIVRHCISYWEQKEMTWEQAIETAYSGMREDTVFMIERAKQLFADFRVAPGTEHPLVRICFIEQCYTSLLGIVANWPAEERLIKMAGFREKLRKFVEYELATDTTIRIPPEYTSFLEGDRP